MPIDYNLLILVLISYFLSYGLVALNIIPNANKIDACNVILYLII